MTIKAVAFGALIAILGTALLTVPAARAADPRCAAPDGAAGTPAPLSHVASVLHPGGTLDVLVVGSATVFGPAAALEAGAAARQAARNGQPPGTVPAGAPALAPSPDAFPMVMGRALQAAVPGLTVHVTVEGGRSLTAADMVNVIRKALAQHPYQLVLWQTGTLEAARNIQPGDFATSLAEGQQAARDGGADLVLVDPQYSRFFQTAANVDPYLQVFGAAAAVPDVVWFRRYDLMRDWVASGQIDLEHTPRAEREAAVTLLHACLGSQLAGLVEDSARS